MNIYDELINVVKDNVNELHKYIIFINGHITKDTKDKNWDIERSIQHLNEVKYCLINAIENYKKNQGDD